MILITQIEQMLLKAIKSLIAEDRMLFNCGIETDFSYDSRKLHEVCINHKLATYLHEYLIPLFQPEYTDKLFVDIEFNRNGINFKELDYNGKRQIVRPDIIVHNRKSEQNKINILIVECKKCEAHKDLIKDDRSKIVRFMKDVEYLYLYGLQIIYCNESVIAYLFYTDADKIKIHRLPI